MERFKNKNVIITGETRGIGKAIATRFLKEGANVIGISKSSSGLEKEGLNSNRYQHVQFDLNNVDKIENLWNKITKVNEKVDVLVNNAGICNYSDFLNLDVEDIKETFNINLTSHLALTRKIINNMIEKEIAGRIIFISSISGLFGGGKQVDYSATKGAMISAVKSLAKAFGKNGITVNTVCPGTIETDINKEVLSDLEVRTKRKNDIPTGRLGKPEDIAGPVIFLASKDSEYINGEALVVDGGWTLNLS